jgi:hypothetical protein
MGAVSHAAQQAFDQLGERVIALLLGLWYVLLSTLHIIGVVTVFSNSTGPYTFGVAAVIMGTAGHFLTLFLGVVLFEGYMLFPVWPRVAFLLTDWLAAVIGALTVGAGSESERRWPVIGNIVLALVMILHVYKYVVIGLKIDSLLL